MTIEKIHEGLNESNRLMFLDDATASPIDGATWTLTLPSEYRARGVIPNVKQVVTYGGGAVGARTATFYKVGDEKILLSAAIAAAGSAGDDIAEQLIGSAPGAGIIVGGRYIPAAAITAGTSGAGTDIQIEVNKRTKALPGTQVAVAKGSNVAADAHALGGDGAAAAWESMALTLEAVGTLSLAEGDALTFEIIEGASAQFPAGVIELELRMADAAIDVVSYVEATGVLTLLNRTGAALVTPRTIFEAILVE